MHAKQEFIVQMRSLSTLNSDENSSYDMDIVYRVIYKSPKRSERIQFIIPSSCKGYVFCLCCMLFTNPSPRVTLGWTGLKICVYSSVNQCINQHEQSSAHINAFKCLMNCQSWETPGPGPAVNVPNLVQFDENITKNRYIVDKVISCVMYCISSGKSSSMRIKSFSFYKSQ